MLVEWSKLRLIERECDRLMDSTRVPDILTEIEADMLRERDLLILRCMLRLWDWDWDWDIERESEARTSSDFRPHMRIS